LDEATGDEDKRRFTAWIRLVAVTVVKVNFRGSRIIADQGRLVTNAAVLFNRRFGVAVCAKFKIMAIVEPGSGGLHNEGAKNEKQGYMSAQFQH
jgi:hypothetical protein